MNKNRNTDKSIEYLYIHRKLNGTITPEENELLSGWLRKSPENLKYFLKIKDFEIDRSTNRTQEAFRELTSTLQKRRRLRYVFSAAAVFFVLLTLAIILPLGKDNPDNSIETSDLKHGSEKAILILSDGSRFELEKKKELTIEEKGSKIHCSNGGLVYSSVENKKPKVVINTVEVPRGGEFFLVLSDSTKVWINSQTVLRYPTIFEGKERRVEVLGEAYFEVKSDPHHPFKVITDHHVVEVTGTAFNLSAFGEENAIVTTLVKGSVSVYHDEASEEKLVLKPGEQSVCYNDSRPLISRMVDVELYTSWRDGYFNFYNQPLESMMNTLARWYNFEFHFSNDKLRDIRFSGRLKRSENFEALLSIIEKTNEVKFDLYENKVIIR